MLLETPPPGVLVRSWLPGVQGPVLPDCARGRRGTPDTANCACLQNPEPGWCCCLEETQEGFTEKVTSELDLER